MGSLTPIFQWLKGSKGRSPLIGLTLGALLLFGLDLGTVPLRDWDEGTVARVAWEIYQSPNPLSHFLHPTLFGAPYWNKPPLVHGLIASIYGVVGVSEWSTRLGPALLTALSVPFLYGLGIHLFRQQTPALVGALVYLTFLPVVRHGRLAMLDGGVLTFSILMIWALFWQRRRWSVLGIGLGFALLSLTKGVMIGGLLVGVAAGFVLWQRCWASGTRLVEGIALGCIPVLGWYGLQYGHYGSVFWQSGIMDQGLSRIWSPVEDNSGPPWFYGLELLKYGWPWLVFCSSALGWAWKNRRSPWAKLVLTWFGVIFLATSCLSTKLPWYILPIYPPVALAVGVWLTHLWHRECTPSTATWFAWIFSLLGVAIACGLGALYFRWWSPEPQPDLQILLGTLTVVLGLSTGLIIRRSRYFIPVLMGGMYIVLLIFVGGEHWVWELAEAYPVKPVAAMIRRSPSLDQPLYTSYPYERPSLNFYSERRVIPADLETLQGYWHREPSLELLLDAPALQDLGVTPEEMIETVGEWTLVRKQG